MYPLLSANVGSAGLSGSAEDENHRHVKLIQIQTGNEALVSRCSLTAPTSSECKFHSAAAQQHV